MKLINYNRSNYPNWKPIPILAKRVSKQDITRLVNCGWCVSWYRGGFIAHKDGGGFIAHKDD